VRGTTRSAVLAALFLVLHLPFLPSSLEDLDSINFALGIRDFDVANHQPHPPGYPLFIAAAKGVDAVVRSEARALSLLGVLSGALGVLALAAFFRRLEAASFAQSDSYAGPSSSSGTSPGSTPDRIALLATLLAATTPLFWFTASRPLSDLPGLAASLGIQALTLAGPSHLAQAAFLAGLGGGIRLQVLWLTAPLIVWQVLRTPRPDRLGTAGRVVLLATAGVLIWLVPMALIEGGPSAYWRALSSQGTEDLTGVQMLWTNRTPHQLLLVLNSTFVAPWASPVLAGTVLVLAAVGFAALLWRARPPLLILIAAYGPYLVFDVLFQESITTRYALPLAVPMAYLAVRGAMLLPARLAMAAVLVAAVAGVVIAQASLVQYARMDAPAFRLIADMRNMASAPGEPAIALAMHRREDLNFRRPIRWSDGNLPRIGARLPAPPKHEWLETVNYWNSGGRLPVWFVADPLRSDLALFDRPSHVAAYRWPLTFPALVGGARPNEMDWHVFDRPGWYLGEGWAVTPESAGVALEDRRGPGLAPVAGWIRRRSDAATLLLGGRNLNGDGKPAAMTVTLDGRTIDEASIPPGFFLRMTTLPPDMLLGAGDYATLQVSAGGQVAIEQFDLQSPDRLVFGFGDGWHEREYDPLRGRLWRWMGERGALQVRGTGAPHVLSLRGETETFDRPSRVVVRAGDRQIAEASAGNSFSLTAVIPGELLPAGESTITIETDQVYVPAERSSRTQDRRKLGLKIFECRLDPAPGSSVPARETEQ
jgi:hypothetical protein